ncbi:thioredoxin domain-containing protein [Atopobacter phocae]|uniref:thioredoxin domain-containing protein n=1 Tax=Atopobacter phocae TaxID=136492 RepID=UPI0004B6811D|nr:thioredoxin domain-containing protein [Atopobacter phocae]
MITETTMEQFDEYAASFQTITAETAQKKLDQEEYVALFVGRRTCPYCRRFVSKLETAAKETNTSIYFLNSEQTDDIEQIEVFRSRHEIKTVPTLLVKSGEQLIMTSDSSMTVEAIKEQLTAK